ncbi:TetR family transcriptional regulator [Stackebrandtia albiflava]|uniref:TetR family transcriptional regulator n=1 Tax=Stackebrandtia albiflava TaxID=406432 RepID=A0A562UQ33_9ACTN|nr:TetR/AcrR family transcriptional regulator [Stackebrandtia albiflava]TWJ07732.1 TetR family transcriptional regulator [Stackebrandtia albiflava]
MNEAELPRAVALAWGVSSRRRPGPKPQLTLDKVVRAAIGLADEKGLAHVSLAELAARLGCATASLYRHVDSKEDLLLLMRDFAARPDREPPGEGDGDWRAALEGIAWAIFDRYRRHPWVLEIPTTGPPTMPGELQWGERILAALAPTGMTAARRLRAVTLLSGYVREQARLALDPVIAGDGGEPDDPGPGYAEIIGRVMTPDRYPAFCHVFTELIAEAPVGYDRADFRFGLDVILTGLAEQIP